MCKNVLPAHMYVNQVHEWYPWRLEEGIRYLETGLMDGVSYHRTARNRNQVLCKSNKYS